VRTLAAQAAWSSGTFSLISLGRDLALRPALASGRESGRVRVRRRKRAAHARSGRVPTVRDGTPPAHALPA
jgi:hypothetical protein